MTPHTATLPGVKSPRPSARRDAPVLIQVPLLPEGGPRGRARRAIRPTPGRGRRRLRREVRVAASTLLVAFPLSWTLFFYANLGPGPSGESDPPAAVVAARVPARAAAPAAEDEPRVTLDLRMPGSDTSAPEAEHPVVLPAGYLVPDDGPEETAHAGH